MLYTSTTGTDHNRTKLQINKFKKNELCRIVCKLSGNMNKFHHKGTQIGSIKLYNRNWDYSVLNFC